MTFLRMSLLIVMKIVLTVIMVMTMGTLTDF